MPGPVTGNEARSLAPLDYGSPPKLRINCAFYIDAFVSPPCSFPNRSERGGGGGGGGIEEKKRKEEREREIKKKSIEEREKRKNKKSDGGAR